MKLHATSKMARAVGAIAWSFDTIVRVGSKYGTKAINKIQNKPTYHIAIEVDNVVQNEFESITISKVNTILQSLELLPNAKLTIRRIL